jgi:hypothetical protein
MPNVGAPEFICMIVRPVEKRMLIDCYVKYMSGWKVAKTNIYFMIEIVL